MKEILHQLVDKKFSVCVGGEFERVTNFIGLMGLLFHYSDVFDCEDKNLQKSFFKNGLKEKEFYVDANITAIFK